MTGLLFGKIPERILVGKVDARSFMAQIRVGPLTLDRQEGFYD